MFHTREILRIAAAVSAFSSAEAASLTGSSEGFHYFYKQGASMDDHDAALVDCAVRTRALVNGSSATDAYGLAAGAAGGFAGGFLGAIVGGIIDNNENRQGAAANKENCMALKGWSVIALTEEEGEALEEPDDPASIHEKLAPYVEAASARGPVLRGPFANELYAGDFKVDKARDLDKVSMSVRAALDQIETAINAAGELRIPKPDLPKGVKAPKPLVAMKAQALGSVDAGASFVVLRTTGGAVDLNMTSVALSRLGPDGKEIVFDGRATLTNLGGKAKKTAKGGDAAGKYYDYVAEVPPGLWKFSAISYGALAADLCFGAPAFNVRSGEVVFLGSMPVAGGYPLSQDLAVAKEILSANPALAEKAKAAEWTNGFTSDCFGSYAYAYEIPGAPFVDMVALARAATAAEAADEQPADGAIPDTISSEGGAEQ